MARPVPADLEEALAAHPAARERFWSMPPERIDSWVDWVERARFPGARRRRVAETVRRLSGPAPAAAVEPAGPAVLVPPREDWALWLIGLTLLAGLAAFLVWFTVYRDHGNSKAAVPRVVGLRYRSAQLQLKEAKLASTLVRRAAAKPRDVVFGQNPNGGATVPQGTPVTLLVSNGPSGIAMPDVVGLAAVDAVNALSAKKLTATLKRVVAAQKTPGTVVAQTPQAGKRAKPGTNVVLQIAKAAAAVAVPDVTGRPQQQATASLQQAGLSARIAQVPSAQPQGTVVAQRPAAGQKVPKGSTVRLNVSKGAAPAATTTQQATTTQTTTPQQTTTAPPSTGNDYTGMRLSAAVQNIAQGRQQAVVVYVVSDKAAGVVVSNSKAGSRERLQVSAGPHPQRATSVPDVNGEDAATAQHDLQVAGFTVIQVQWPATDTSQNGLVVYETPGGQAPEEAAIVIYVGSSS